MKKLEEYVRSIKDYPKEGINFRDITTVIQDPEGLRMSIEAMKTKLENIDFDLVVGPEARGFIFGVPVAYCMDKGFIPIRKKGKLPFETVEESYDLEYGSATIEIHKDAIKAGQKVVIVDDLMATGGTTKAMINLIEKLGGKVEKVVCLIELEGLRGKDKIQDYDFEAIITYPGA